jgi:hypothetical protein
MKTEEYKAEECIGMPVLATMNGANWYKGTLEKLGETFAQYGVRVKDSGEPIDAQILDFLDDYCIGIKVSNEAGHFSGYYRCDDGIRHAVMEAVKDKQANKTKKETIGADCA